MKNKTILIYILLVLIIIFSFTIPKMITKIQDKKILSDRYTTNKQIRTLNENAKMVGLIETIYSKYNTNKYDVQVSTELQETIMIREGNDSYVNISIDDKDDIITNASKLINYNIIKSEFYNQFSSEFIRYRTWNYDNGDVKYSVVKIYVGEKLEDEIASFEVENDTNKIIAYTVKKELSNINRKYTTGIC